MALVVYRNMFVTEMNGTRFSKIVHNLGSLKVVQYPYLSMVLKCHQSQTVTVIYFVKLESTGRSNSLTKNVHLITFNDPR